MFNFAFQAMSESIDPLLASFPANHRHQRPPLLPTPSMPPRFNRNMSMNSDSTRSMNGPDDIESVDMEMSDDDTGMDNRSVGSSGGEFKLNFKFRNCQLVFFSDHREFSMQNMFQMPHQINMNRPPPPLMQVGEMSQQKKSWIHNQGGNDHTQFDDGSSQMNEPPPSLLGIAPPNFMPQNNFPSPGSFRGNRGGKPFNNFRGGRGGMRPRGRGAFRGNFKGQGQW